jgi:hypothetical protein
MRAGAKAGGENQGDYHCTRSAVEDDVVRESALPSLGMYG